jgi:hypothetical protein
VATVVELQATADRVKLTVTFDAMHDDLWTERARAGHESQMRKLDGLLAAQGKTVRSWAPGPPAQAPWPPVRRYARVARFVRCNSLWPWRYLSSDVSPSRDGNARRRQARRSKRGP